MAAAQSAPGQPDAAGVELKNDPAAKTVEVHIRSEHFTTYHYGETQHMPFLWPVKAEGGVGVTQKDKGHTI